MVHQVVWTRKALADLRGIKDYISQDSTRYAHLQIERIRSAASHLGRFPHLGRALPEFPDEPWREILTGNYRVIYRVDAAGARVVLLAVVHGMQILWATMIEPG
jgi:plasmid stabilization system protein ParE